MGIRHLNIRKSYVDKGDALLRDFLLPVIREAVQYDRTTCVYTLEALLAVSQGIQTLFERHCRMRLLVGIHCFHEKISNSSLAMDYLVKQISSLQRNIIKEISSLTGKFEMDCLLTLSRMIQGGFLSIKAVSAFEDEIFHSKTLILSDGHDKIVALGSSREAINGIGGNYEQIIIADSWDSPKDVDVQESFFESIWNNSLDDVIVYDISKETSDMILHALKNDAYPLGNCRVNGYSAKQLIELSAQMPANFFVSGDIPALYMHQERAVLDALSRWPVRVLFADEVGLGKTFEIAATTLFLKKYCGIRRVLILTPKSVLNQWQEELKNNFGIDAWIFDSSSRRYFNSDGHFFFIENDKSPLGEKSPEYILMSSQYAARRYSAGQDIFLNNVVLPDLLIVDEAHSARCFKDISGKEQKTYLYRLLERVAPEIPHLILATATPMLKDASEYHSILKILGLPKKWRKERVYLTSLKLIASGNRPDITDAAMAGTSLLSTIFEMAPSFGRLTKCEQNVLRKLMSINENSPKDSLGLASCVQDNWPIFRSLFIKLHPAHLLTVRNTRRSLEAIGYRFPKRNLLEESIDAPINVQLFYHKVESFLYNSCFLIEKQLFSNKKISLGFVRSSYQQRVASSLHSCMRSLERRRDKISALRERIACSSNCQSCIEFDDIDIDGLLDDNTLDNLDDNLVVDSSIDLHKLLHLIELENMELSELISEADNLISSCGDLKIYRALDIAFRSLKNGDAVLVFSRYTDTIDALLESLMVRCDYKGVGFGVYTGKETYLVSLGIRKNCDKDKIKSELFSGRLKLLFCSDAASEGLNLQAARVLINVDVPWTPARLEQRIGRIARLGQIADEVDIFNIWYPNSVEAKMYHRIQKRLDETNLALGEFPELVAQTIKKLVIEDDTANNRDLELLKQIRNATQVDALNELWSFDGVMVSISRSMREDLMKICSMYFECLCEEENSTFKSFRLPDGNTVSLSASEGMFGSISLKSDLLNYIQDDSSKYFPVYAIYDSNDRPSFFEILSGTEKVKLNHSSILKIILGESIDSKFYLTDYPKLLPDNTKLSLNFSVKSVDNRPSLWIYNQGDIL